MWLSGGVGGGKERNHEKLAEVSSKETQGGKSGPNLLEDIGGRLGYGGAKTKKGLMRRGWGVTRRVGREEKDGWGISETIKVKRGKQTSTSTKKKKR